MTRTTFGFAHVFEPGAEEAPVLLLLHGTGGDEHDMVPLGRLLAPHAGVLSPRGNVLEFGRPRFFRRLAEGVFDLDDLARRTDELSTFLDTASQEYRLRPGSRRGRRVSNGANIAGSLILRRPGQVTRAILLRPMLPFQPDGPVALSGTRVLVAPGRSDPIIPSERTDALVHLLATSGAEVSLAVHAGGHELGDDDVRAARKWLVGD